MIQITVSYLPHGEEDKAEPLGFARICNLREHEPGSDLGNFHAYFEANEPPMASSPPPYLPDDPRRTYHKVADAIVVDYPRREGSVWDLIAAMLQQAGRGRPATRSGLTLADIPTGG
jgi:hypothetical protein